jgi:hypothetical protein
VVISCANTSGENLRRVGSLRLSPIGLRHVWRGERRRSHMGNQAEKYTSLRHRPDDHFAGLTAKEDHVHLGFADEAPSLYHVLTAGRARIRSSLRFVARVW